MASDAQACSMTESAATKMADKFGGVGRLVDSRAVVFPWKGRDPREADWMCKTCGALCGKESTMYVCHCGLKRVFSPEELAQIEAADRAGELIFSEVRIFESAHRELEASLQCAREWYDALLQKMVVDAAAFVLAPVFNHDQEEKQKWQNLGVKIVPGGNCPEKMEAFTFSPPRSLDSITKEILRRKFNIIDILEGVPRYELSRYLLVTLILANTLNVEVVADQQAHGTSPDNEVHLKLLKLERHHEVFEDEQRLMMGGPPAE